MFPRNKYLVLRMGQKEVLCEDVLESMVRAAVGNKYVVGIVRVLRMCQKEVLCEDVLESMVRGSLDALVSAGC